MIRKIINARIVDGSGEAPFLGGVEIKDGRINRVFRGPSRDRAEDVLDAQGMVLTPGFVDIHRHHDIAALLDPEFGSIELAQGITTAVCGNCGLAPFPNSDRTRAMQFRYIEPCLGKMPEDTPIHLVSEFMDALEEKKLPIHVGVLVGAGACASSVIGYEHRGFTSEERQQAVMLVRDGMEHGALGLSFGIMYEPECYLSREDQVAMAREAGLAGGFVSCHIRGEGDSLVESVKEIIGICEEASVPLNISHFKSTGLKNWNKAIFEAIDVIESARARGVRVTCDAYPYNAGATTAMSLIPPEVLEGRSTDYLATDEGISHLKRLIYQKIPGWDNMVESIGWDRVVIGGVNLAKNREYAGKSVQQISDALGMDPTEFFARLVAEEEGKVGITIFSMSETDVEQVLKLPYSVVISDSLYGGMEHPHPRLYGSFPRFLRKFVVEDGVLSLEEAVRKMTFLPAKRVGLKDRGLIEPGYAADLNLFDLQSITDQADFVNPKQLAEGIFLTLVEGKEAAANSRRLEGAYGKLLRKQGTEYEFE
ncbi:MAG: amidohydrolase family protein [Firmicutes bacterium]|nr:amidohydrolase family protein [Bacillota bacterium]